MSMRVSSIQIANSALLGISESYSRFDKALQTVNTGKIIQKPSDDPFGTAQSLNLRERIDEIDQSGRTMDQAKGFLSTSEAALDSVSNLLRQARSIGVQGANDSLTGETRQALANQIQNIIDQLGNIGNTTYGERYVFAGQRTNAPPFHGGPNYNYNGGTAATGDADINLNIGRGETLTINASGDKVFTPLFTTLAKLRDDVGYGASSIISQTDLTAVDTQINNVLSVRADMGSKVNRLDVSKQRNDLIKVNFTQFVSNLEDADIPKAVVALQTAQTGYQAALTATAHAFQNSLLDYLKV